MTCSTHDHRSVGQDLPWSDTAMERCARLFRAMSDPGRLRLLARLGLGPACVSELAAAERQSLTVVSQRLRVLRADNLVRRTRDGKHIVYALADDHMFHLVTDGLAHASEGPASTSRFNPNLKGFHSMTATQEHQTHEQHDHQHGQGCGHTAVQHDGHVDFLHDGHLHHEHDGHIDEHRVAVSSANPENCTDGHPCEGHEASHVHGADCGHEAVPHGDHTDYLVDGHLHHAHEGHCDHHGELQVVS